MPVRADDRQILNSPIQAARRWPETARVGRKTAGRHGALISLAYRNNHTSGAWPDGNRCHSLHRTLLSEPRRNRSIPSFSRLSGAGERVPHDQMESDPRDHPCIHLVRHLDRYELAGPASRPHVTDRHPGWWSAKATGASPAELSSNPTHGELLWDGYPEAVRRLVHPRCHLIIAGKRSP